MRTFKLILSYDGSRYRGWQRLGNTDNTIQAKVEDTLSRLLAQPVLVQGSGRTDAGVHAAGQVCSFHADTDKQVDVMLTELRKHLPGDIGALSLEEADPRFHARLLAKEKTYVYRIWNSDMPNVFERKYLYCFPAPLDLTAMRKAAELLVGTHDFAAFCSRAGGKKSTVRTLRELRIQRFDEEIRIFFTGDGFLYNMVRILTGTLLEVGLHRLSPARIPELFASGTRAQAGFTVPPHGLCLLNVEY